MGVVKITQLPSVSSVTDDDLFVMVDSPNDQAITKKVSASTLRSSVLNQAATLQLKQGLDSERLLVTPSVAEPLWTTDTKKLYVGDGSTVGGIVISSPIVEISGNNTTKFNNILGSGNLCLGSGNSIISSLLGSSFNYNGIYHANTCTASGYNITILSGNGCVGSGVYTSILNGDRNTAGSPASSNATIITGLRNTVTSPNYGLICNGTFNMSRGTYSSIINGFGHSAISDYTFIGNGNQNTATANYSSIINGQNNIASGIYSSILGGISAKTTLYGEVAQAGGSFASAGDAQRSTIVLRTETSSNTSNVILTANGSASLVTSPSNTTSRNFIFLPDKTTVNFNIQISAYNDTDTSSAVWNFVGGIKRGVGASTTALIETPTETSWKDAGMTSALASVAADATNGGLSIRVTGLATKNIRWVAAVNYCQASYGTP
jgi:hypothetical protein